MHRARDHCRPTERGDTAMLMHEWIRYRDRKLKRSLEDEEEKDAAEPAEGEELEAEQAEIEEAVEVEAGPEVAEPPPTPVSAEEEAAEPEGSEVAEPDESVAEVAEEPEPEPEPAPEPQAEASETESTVSDRAEVLASLREQLERAGQNMSERLEQLQARQRQLPIDIHEAQGQEEDSGGRKRASETRQELVQRLLDPTLTLREASLLLEVCPTTVRRYTNRGLLNCFRTPGNQRRFHLSDILDFMERRERGEV